MFPTSNRRDFLRHVTAAGLVLNTTAQVMAAPGDTPLEVGQESQLFLDDYLVASQKGVRHVLHQPVKTGLIQEADGGSWQFGEWPQVIRDTQGRFHMTYRFIWWDPSVKDLHPGIGNDKAHWFRQSVGYATSDDGIRWQKPKLGLVEGPTGFRPAPKSKWADGVFLEPVAMSRENNLGCPIASWQDLLTFGGISDPRKRFLINVVSKDDTHPFAATVDAGLYFAAEVPDVARDAKWRDKLAVIWTGKQRGARSELTHVAGFDPAANFWFECSQSPFGDWVPRGGRDIARWTTTDLKSWSGHVRVLPITDDESREASDFVEYMEMNAFRAGGAWLGQLVIFHGDRTDPQGEMPTARGVWRKGTTELRLVVSRDAGKSWQRIGGKQAWLPHHTDDHGFDRMTYIGTPVHVGDELWFYYGAWDGNHLTWRKDGTPYYPDRMRIGRVARATLRWDGYASLRADEGAEIVTKPIKCGGRKLVVNAAAGKGSVRVELLDADGKPVPKCTLADCTPLTGDGVAQGVTWGNQATVPDDLQNRPLRLRFELTKADLYGFRFPGSS